MQTASAGPSVFANQVVILVLLLGAMWLLLRWKDSGDRSAYAVGAFLAIVTPLVAAAEVFWELYTVFMMGFEPFRLAWAMRVVSAMAGLVFLFFTLRPWFLTGMFAFAPQAKIRNAYHRIESSWQYAVATWVAGFVVVYVLRLFGPRMFPTLF